MRDYLILSRYEDETKWTERGVVQAHSPEGAIKRAVKDKVEGQVFVAVPKRNWTVAKPSVKEVEPVIELEIIEGQLTVEDVIAANDDTTVVNATPSAA